MLKFNFNMFGILLFGYVWLNDQFMSNPILRYSTLVKTNQYFLLQAEVIMLTLVESHPVSDKYKI